MAKMISNYAINVMWKTWTIANASKCSFSDLKSISVDLQPYANISCQLWLMWMDSKWWINKKFNPRWEVTRAQFATILSRLLRWDRYNKTWWDYYAQHLKALNEEWIINYIAWNPAERKELRWRAMIMLKRASEE
jgi:hypothetical protein